MGGHCFCHGLFLILEPSSNADLGHRAKHPVGFRMGESSFMKEQWAHMRQVTVPASTPAAEEDIDHRPSWEPTRPTVKREWSRSISSMKRKVTTLTEADEATLFRTSQFPSSLLHVEPRSPSRMRCSGRNVAGACGLALVRCGEMAFSLMGKESTLMSRLHDAINGDSPQDKDSLLQVLKDTKEDLVDIHKGLGKIANVGTDIAAGSFNQGVDELRHLVWELPLSKAVRPTLELCPPSLTHLFGDDARIREALEAERKRPYQAGSFRSKPNFSPRSNKNKTWTKKKPKPARKSRGKSSYTGPARKANGPASKKGEGQKNQ
jgi:hypothetical protein